MGVLRSEIASETSSSPSMYSRTTPVAQPDPAMPWARKPQWPKMKSQSKNQLTRFAVSSDTMTQPGRSMAWR